MFISRRPARSPRAPSSSQSTDPTTLSISPTDYTLVTDISCSPGYRRVRPRLRARVCRFCRRRVLRPLGLISAITGKQGRAAVRPDVHAGVWVRIVGYLDYGARLRLRQVCRAMRDVVDASYRPQVWAISVGAEGVELRFSDGGGMRRLPFSHRGLDYYARGAALEASALKYARQVRLLGDGASPPPPRLNEILAHLPATCTVSIDRLARTASTPLAFPPLTTIRLSAWHLSGPAASRLVMGAHGARRLSLALSPALGRLHPLLPSHAEARGRGTVLLNRAVSVLSLWISGGPQRPKAEDVLSALRLLFADLHSDQIAQGLRVEIDSDWRRFGGDLSPSALVYLVADLFRTDPRCVVLNSRGVWGMAERKPPIAPSSLGIP